MPEVMDEVQYSIEKHREAVEAAREWAEVIEESPNTLMLDLDTPEAEDHFWAQDLDKFGFTPTKIEDWPSKSHRKGHSGHRHVLITTEQTWTPVAKYGIQAILGSDYKREAVSLARFLSGDTTGQVLFKPKPKEVKPIVDVECSF